ncbi:MAG TPA: hypothetical protein VG077_19535 [Verrucomicrobiae bacterium]|nr:hypothetical protein [Verrucomicrobiae bacterium]
MIVDAALMLSGNLPAAGANTTLVSLDLAGDATPFSEVWRLGFLQIFWPALPNCVAGTVTIALVDSADNGATYQAGGTGTAALRPLIQLTLTGGAGGVAAGSADMPFPPGLRGPCGLLLTASANAGDNTAAVLQAGFDTQAS